MRSYDWLLLDADNTLFDFHRCEGEALRLALLDHQEREGVGGLLTITGGKTTESNAIINSSLESTHSGGGIRFNSLGTLSLTSSTVSGNSTAGNSAWGGGVFTNGNVTLTSSTVSGNSTAGNNAAGGGVYT